MCHGLSSFVILIPTVKKRKQNSRLSISSNILIRVPSSFILLSIYPISKLITHHQREILNSAFIMSEEKSIIFILFDIFNYFIEVYLTHIIKPFLTLHETFYSWLNATIRSILDDKSEHIPTWFSANFITYIRTIFVVPCVLLMVNGHVLLPSLIVILVDFGDFLDGVVARFWVDIKKEEDMENLVTEEGVFSFFSLFYLLCVMRSKLYLI